MAAVGRFLRRRVLKLAQKCSMGLRSGGVGRKKKQLAARRRHQRRRGRRLMKPGVVQDNHAAFGQLRQQHFFKIGVHHLRVATALKHQRCHQTIVFGSGDDTGAFPASARHRRVNPFTSGGAAPLPIQPVIHAALVEVIHGLGGQPFEFAPEEPALDLVPLAVFYEFFLR